VWRRHPVEETPLRCAICIAAGRSAAPAAATLHSVFSTYVKIRPKTAENGDKNYPLRVSGAILRTWFWTAPRHVASERLPKAATTFLTVRKSGATRIGVFRTIHPFRKVFELIDRRFGIYRPTWKRLVWRRHADEENVTAMRNLHRGGAHCRAGGSDTPLGLEHAC